MPAPSQPLQLTGEAGVVDCLLDLPDDAAHPAPRGWALILHPHSLMGGTRDNKVVTTLSKACLQHGLATVRPNFRGVGNSAGEFDHAKGEARDMLKVVEQLRQRIAAGESFADLARRFSADATAPQGGDLGWVNPGDTVPAFAQAMDALSEGEVSAPVQSPFGWHLITVEARRVQDMANELLRMQARQTLFERRAQPAFENWLAQLHDQAYIDNRLEKRQQLEQSL